MKTLNYALIGTGGRGNWLLDSMAEVESVRCVAVCDEYKDKAETTAEKLEKNAGFRPTVYTCYKECMNKEKLDFIIVATAWHAHLEITMYSMDKGIAVGCEVGGAYSIHSLWELVRKYEQTKTPVMLLENACYSRIKLLTLNLKRLGLLGEIVHLEGAYRHDLREEVANGEKNRHYRLRQYKHRNTENYPTHEIGPIAKLIDINCGNRFLSLYSIASKSRGIQEYVNSRNIESLKGVEFNQGDVISTVIKCQNGETVTIHLDTSLPRFYARGFLAQGTKGLVSEDLQAVYFDDVNRTEESFWQENYNNINEYYEKYEHPVWQGYDPSKGGHGGIDVLTLRAFVKAVRDGKEMPIDVYDMATWMAISVLSEESLTTGQPVYFPDFTDGKWMFRTNEFEK